MLTNNFFRSKMSYFLNIRTYTYLYYFIILDTAYREIKRLFPSEWKRAVSDLLLFITITINLNTRKY